MKSSPVDIDRNYRSVPCPSPAPQLALLNTLLFARRLRIDALCDRWARTFDGVPEEVASTQMDQATAEARRETADFRRAAGRRPPLP